MNTHPAAKRTHHHCLQRFVAHGAGSSRGRFHSTHTTSADLNAPHSGRMAGDRALGSSTVHGAHHDQDRVHARRLRA